MSVSVFLIRHAKAGRRDRWDGPDDARPLTPAGSAQASALVTRFAGIAIVRFSSSPALRCIQTLEPLAADRDLAIGIKEDLAEGTPAERAIGLVIGSADAPTALCSHGDVIQATIQALRAAGTPTAGKVGFAKGSAWELVVGDGVVTGLRYLPSPAG